MDGAGGAGGRAAWERMGSTGARARGGVGVPWGPELTLDQNSKALFQSSSEALGCAFGLREKDAAIPQDFCFRSSDSMLFSEMLGFCSMVCDTASPGVQESMHRADLLVVAMCPGSRASELTSEWMAPCAPAHRETMWARGLAGEGPACLGPAESRGRPAFASRQGTSLQCWKCCSCKDFHSHRCPLETNPIAFTVKCPGTSGPVGRSQES